MAMQSVQGEFVILAPPERAIKEWQLKYNNWLADGKFRITEQTSDRLTYTRTYIPGPAILFSILLFPLGLLLLLIKRECRLTMTFEPSGENTQVMLSGSAARDQVTDLRGVIDDHNRKALDSGKESASKVTPDQSPEPHSLNP